MHTFRRVCLAFVTEHLHKLFVRLNSTGRRPPAPLGARILTSHDDIFQHNMWDHVQWTDEDKENARKKAEENSCVQIPLNEQGKFDVEACKYWNRFYETHQGKFFKNRKWLFNEFPELLPLGHKSICGHESQGRNGGSGRETETGHNQSVDPSQQLKDENIAECHHLKDAVRVENQAAVQTTSFPGQHAAFRILEVGCGVGNSVFPIVESIKERDAFLYCCDFAPHAIQLVKGHPDYDQCVCHAFVCDISEETASFPFPPQSLDVILAVFVLSSIHPERMQGVVNRLSTYLKYGGIFLFRDYGRYDLSQLRFKKGRCLSENFYTRGDGTCVYFFSKDDVHTLFSNTGMEEIQNLEDRRLQVNRGKKVAMHRVWMQSKYQKVHLKTPPCPF